MWDDGEGKNWVMEGGHWEVGVHGVISTLLLMGVTLRPWRDPGGRSGKPQTEKRMHTLRPICK